MLLPGWIATGVIFAINLLVPLYVYARSQARHAAAARATGPRPLPAPHRHLDAQEMLGWEFEYARTTASEAMAERHTMVNFYLLVAGFVVAGVAAVLAEGSGIPSFVATVLLWLLCCIGWVHYLSIIRLRQAWHESARAMNQIKFFYVEHTALPPAELYEAFRWKKHTLPRPDKPWNVFYYSALLIALLDSVAFFAGGYMLTWSSGQAASVWEVVVLGALGLLLFAFHVWLYGRFLRPHPAPATQAENRPLPDGALVDLQEEVVQYSFHSLFRIVEARLRYRRSDGRMSAPLTRVNFERGAAAGVLLYDPDQDAVILVRQFRYPVYAALSPEDRAGDRARQAWTLEIVAGVQEDGQTAAQVAQRELLEEAGYRLSGPLHPITTIYPSPGGSSERIHLYWGTVDATDKAEDGGGLEGEGEDTEVVVLPFAEAMGRVERGEIVDGKTVLCLQYLALHKSLARTSE